MIFVFEARLSFSQPDPDAPASTSQSSGFPPSFADPTFAPAGTPASSSTATPRQTQHGATPAHERGPQRSSMRDNGAMTPRPPTSLNNHLRRPGKHHIGPNDGATPGGDWEPHMDRRGVVPHQDVERALVGKGFSEKEAAAITGNLIHESGGNQLPGHPVVLNPPTGGNSGDAAWGAAQWEGKRKSGLGSPNLDAQAQHIWDEMHGPEAGAYHAMQRARTVSEKAHIVNVIYERPKAPRLSDADRRGYAEEAYKDRAARLDKARESLRKPE